MTYRVRPLYGFLPYLFAGLLVVSPARAQQPTEGLVPRFEKETSGLQLERAARAGAFFNVVGRRAAVLGYESQPLEVWTYPLKILHDFTLSFQLEGHDEAVSGLETMTHIDVRPEATTLTYTDAAFTIRQTMLAPIDEMGVVMLFDVDSAHPLEIAVSFRPDLRLMGPAGLVSGDVTWEADHGIYTLMEERNRFVGMIGAPGARDISMMPDQGATRDAPTRLVLPTTPEQTAGHLMPLVIAGSVTGRADARATYERLLGAAETLYRENVRYYKDFLDRTVGLHTPDERLNTAFAWAKVGTDKGFATNPMLGTGLVAGFRTAGHGERPGVAPFFGRDALWTTFALLAYGDVHAASAALDFLAQFQRDDGKIPHEISQNAALFPWFDDYASPWASADATPLFIIAHADFWRATGNLSYLREHWSALKKAYAFTAATDTDGNHLIENTHVGHGWVEGGLLFPAHEEIYMQGLWVEAARSMAELAEAMNDPALASEARAVAERTREATEAVYWLDEDGFYAFATRPSGPAERYEENTVLPAVPLWWNLLAADRADRTLDHLGGGALSTGWGTRILSARSDLYDPLSHYNGSVWPLFTGWVSMGGYRYDRPHIGYQALMANALLTDQDALGYVTERLSGDHNTPFGRSSHHQIGSEAMVITPALRGMLGLESLHGGARLRFAPQLPADWDFVEVRHVAARRGRYDFAYERTDGGVRITITQRQRGQVEEIELAPAFPLDAVVQTIQVNGRNVVFNLSEHGDQQRAIVRVDATTPRLDVVFNAKPGTGVYTAQKAVPPGSTNDGLRLLRARTRDGALHLRVEGRGGHTYTLYARTPHRLTGVDGVAVSQPDGEDATLEITFDGPAEAYVRRDIRLPLEP